MVKWRNSRIIDALFIVNLLFDGLAYNTSEHFAHCSYYYVTVLVLRNSQNIRTYYMLNQLQIKEGDIFRVFDTSRKDVFLVGKVRMSTASCLELLLE